AGGGFMAGAMQTAVGVAGGMLLANAVSGLFSSPAEAAEVAEPPADMPAEDFHDGEIGGEDPGAFEDFGDDEGF
ncbi:MAG: DUF2076 family protein, partial [Sphingobacteriia bacterium]|nr:DUF2076 family protein [Sphingobacteriia bacterium]